MNRALLVAQMVKNPRANTGDLGSIPGSGRSSGEGNGNPLQYSWLENPRDRGAWRATVHGVTKSWARRRDKTTTTTTSRKASLGPPLPLLENAKISYK